MIDLHTHVLHGLDDGPATLEQSVALAQAALADGATTVVATPHVYKNRLDVRDRGLVLERIAELQRQVPQLRILPGAEVHLVPDLLERVRDGQDFFLLGGGRALLLEIPDLILPPALPDLIFDLSEQGVSTVIAHPERNVVLHNDWEAVNDLVDAGALLQITDRHLLGQSARAMVRFCRRLVENGLVFAIASDAHGDSGRMPALSAARQRLRDWFGPEPVDPLFEANPGSLIPSEG